MEFPEVNIYEFQNIFIICMTISIFQIVNAEKIYDNFGFNEDGIHEFTKNEYDRRGFNKEGIHMVTNTNLDENGYDADGYKNEIIYNYSTVKNCVVKDGFNHRGFNRFNKHKITGTNYDPDGFDCYGFDINVFNKSTNTEYDADFLNREGIHKKGYFKYRSGAAALPPIPY